jgi:hypothetical protein
MFERVPQIQHQEIALEEMALGENRATGRPVPAGTIFHAIAGRLIRALHALAAFFAAGGALS